VLMVHALFFCNRDVLWFVRFGRQSIFVKVVLFCRPVFVFILFCSCSAGGFSESSSFSGFAPMAVSRLHAM
jgi:hypothetical protein